MAVSDPTRSGEDDPMPAIRPYPLIQSVSQTPASFAGARVLAPGPGFRVGAAD